MGDHTKIVPKKLITTKGEHELRESDFLLELIPSAKNLSLEGITPPYLLDQTCLIKTFEIHEFDRTSVVLWQVGEGLMNGNKMWRFGYENKNIGKKIFEDIGKMFLSKIIEDKKPALIIVSNEIKKLTYKEVIIS